MYDTEHQITRDILLKLFDQDDFKSNLLDTEEKQNHKIEQICDIYQKIFKAVTTAKDAIKD